MTSTGGVEGDVALKVLHGDLDPKSQGVSRLLDEARMLGLLNHPCIVQGTDLVLLDGRVALVTEYVPGGDLDGCIHSPPPMPTRILLEVLSQVADALHTAYSALSPSGQPLHLIHRDVKPQNIRIGKHGAVKLLDFGVARAANIEREAETMADTVVGSTLYMAPERFNRDNPVLPSSDVYSLGLSLYEGLTGEAFFDKIPVNQQFFLSLNSHSHQEYLQKRLAKLTDAPPEIVRLATASLDYDPQVRPTSLEFARLCEDICEELTGPTLRKWCRSRTWPAPAGVAGAKLVGKTIVESNAAAIQPKKTQSTPQPQTRIYILGAALAVIAAALVVILAALFGLYFLG